MNFPILTAIWLMPVIGILVLFLVPGKNHRAVKWVALSFAMVSFILSLILFFSYNYHTGGLQFVERIPWLTSIGINYYLGVNGIGLVLVLLTGIITVTGILLSWDIEHRTKEFFMLLLTLSTGVFGVFESQNLFLFFLFYEAAVLPKYLLIGVWGIGKKEYAAMKLTIYLFFGSAFILAGILGLYFASGTHSFDMDVLAQFAFTATFQKIFFPILFFGFGIVAAIFPFYTWAPDGHASAPTAVSMLSAGIIMKLGAYGCLAVAVYLLPVGAKFWMPVMAVLAVINIVYGSLLVLVQKDLKYIAAYSSISHMGIVLLGICALNATAFSGAVLQMFSHGILTGLFFGGVGLIYHRAHTRNIDEMSGLAKRVPVLAVVFILTGLLSLGLPGMSGFVAELPVFLGSFKSFPILTVLAVTGIVVTAFYMLRVVQIMFFGKLNPKYEHMHDVTKVEMIAFSILLFFVFAIGLYPYYVMNIIHSAVSVIAQKLGGM